jgi:hypothetical protein
MSLLKVKRKFFFFFLSVWNKNIVFTHLDLSSLATVVKVCKFWHSAAIHGRIWRSAYMKRWGQQAVRCIEGVDAGAPDVVNW